jgi:hypothetical protein
VLAPPAAPTLSTVPGGQLPSRYYNVLLTYTNPAGETMASVEVSNFNVPAGSLIQVASPAGEEDALGWNVYISEGPQAAIGNTASLEELKQNLGFIPIGLSWTEPQTGLIYGAAMPVVPTALTPVPTVVETNSSAAPVSGQQIGGDIYLLESLAQETLAQTQARVLEDAQENLNLLAPYFR